MCRSRHTYKGQQVGDKARAFGIPCRRFSGWTLRKHWIGRRAKWWPSIEASHSPAWCSASRLDLASAQVFRRTTPRNAVHRGQSKPGAGAAESMALRAKFRSGARAGSALMEPEALIHRVSDFAVEIPCLEATTGLALIRQALAGRKLPGACARQSRLSTMSLSELGGNAGVKHAPEQVVGVRHRIGSGPLAVATRN